MTSGQEGSNLLQIGGMHNVRALPFEQEPDKFIYIRVLS